MWTFGFPFFSFSFFKERHNLLSRKHDREVSFQSGICPWAMSSKKKKKNVLTVLIKIRNFCPQTKALVMFLYVELKPFCLLLIGQRVLPFFLAFSAVQWLMSSCCISSCFFYVKKQETVVLYLGITDLTVMFPVDINKTQTFYQIWLHLSGCYVGTIWAIWREDFLHCVSSDLYCCHGVKTRWIFKKLVWILLSTWRFSNTSTLSR